MENRKHRDTWQKSYAIRYLVVVVVFIAVSWLRIVNVLTLFAGIMSFKACSIFAANYA